MKYIKIILMILISLMIILLLLLFPLFLFLNLKNSDQRFFDFFSPDGIMGYIATLLSSVATIVVSCIAHYEVVKKHEVEEYAKKLEHREKIKPILSLAWEENKIKVKNVSKNTALAIYYETETVKESLLPKQEFVIEIDENCIPSSVFLSYEDIDRNCMSCEFVLVDEKIYILRDFYYIALKCEGD